MQLPDSVVRSCLKMPLQLQDHCGVVALNARWIERISSWIHLMCMSDLPVCTSKLEAPGLTGAVVEVSFQNL